MLFSCDQFRTIYFAICGDPVWLDESEFEMLKHAENLATYIQKLNLTSFDTKLPTKCTYLKSYTSDLSTVMNNFLVITSDPAWVYFKLLLSTADFQKLLNKMVKLLS